MLLRDRTVLISGVGAGLGHRVAAACVREGGCAVLGARTRAGPERCAAAIDPDGTRTAHRTADITDEAQCRALAALAVERFGRLDAVVHVAALDTVMGGLEDSSEDLGEWQRAVDVNLLGTLRMTRACLPALKESGGGSVVMIGTQASVAASSQVPMAAYAASKGALVSAMYPLARELGPYGIRVNTVQPGWMWGPPVRAYVEDDAELLARLNARMALPGMVTDEDVAETVVFFASDRSRGITGQSLLVNAGEVMR
ncbi:SDR family oxidoreductase [Streptomyces boncukensis]|uniref:SDR family oxidoreductase n=1 Tax=Streptomyces boncukensis TaxID=2711219 RepID=A0A6G4X345_9ACTN|nr:SDR family oxidoreductase [Streptomyces boncukensis]NGO71959.1 SDR family oxidoreductase [Streptomyces boncukensis]